MAKLTANDFDMHAADTLLFRLFHYQGHENWDAWLDALHGCLHRVELQDGTFICIGDYDGKIWLNADWDDDSYATCLDLAVPGLSEWYAEFPLSPFWWRNEDSAAAEIIRSFDFLSWEQRGVELARAVKQKLPPLWTLTYVTPFEDRFSGFPEETPITDGEED